MGEPVAKRNKIDATDKVLNQIAANELEVVECTGKSLAWKKFVKLRNKATNTFIDYVQCKECKVLRLYSRKNGTTTLIKHNCHNENENENGDTIFKEMSAEIASELKTILTRKLMELCAEDVILVDMISGPGFLRFVQGLALVIEKYGQVDFQKVFPNTTAINRCIQNIKNEQQLQIAESFKCAFIKNWCSLSMNTWHPDINESQSFLIASVNYFNDDLTAFTKQVLFTVPVQGHCNYEKLMSEVQKKIKAFGCDEIKLKDMNIVTPIKEVFTKTLNLKCNRENCVAFMINLILKTSFTLCSGNEISEILSNCKEIVRHIIETEKNTKLKFEVIEDVGTWKSKVDMITSLTCQYNDVITLLNDEGKAELKFNKSKAEELVQVLKIFVEAIEDLQSTTYTTINKILPWWSLLLDHLNSTEEYSIEMKVFMQQAKSVFATHFIPTMNQKVACFLDPRYRRLKMLPELERTAVINEIRLILEGIPAEVPVNVPDVANNLQKKKSKFSRFEADEDDIGEMDEVNIYIHSTQLNMFNFDDSEFSIIGQFWKNHEKKLPKLFKVATTRLHMPASCCGGKKILQRKTVQLDQFDDLLLVRDNLPGLNQ